MHRLKKRCMQLCSAVRVSINTCVGEVIVVSHHTLSTLAVLQNHLKNPIYKYFYSYLNNVACH